MSNKPTTVAVATYASKADAESDYEALRAVKTDGALDHIAIAFVEKDAEGKLKISRHDSTAKHLAWGGAALGAALTVVFAPLGVVFLAPLAVHSAVWAGAGGLVGHFWHNIPKDDVRKMSDVLEAGDFGLFVVAVNPKGTDVLSLLSNAVDSVVVDQIDEVDSAFEAEEA